MFGDKLFAIAVNVFYTGDTRKGYYENSWGVFVEFEDFGHGDDKSIHGRIKLKYENTLEFSIDTMIEDCEKLGIEFANIPNIKPLLVYDNKEGYPPPENILEILQEQAERIGFQVDKDSISPPSGVIPYG